MISKRRKTLGQHFLDNKEIISRIIAALDLTGKETICEAGTGRGELTQELCHNAKSVVSYEIDKKLYEKTRKKFFFSERSPPDNLKLIDGDIFSTSKVDTDIFVSNLPYSKSKDALIWLSTQRFNRSVIMVQREFADKILSRPGDLNFRAISAIVQYRFKIEKLFDVGKDLFHPPPKVSSTVLRLVPRLNTSIDYETALKVKLLFSQKNKKINSVLEKFNFPHHRFHDDLRVREIHPEEIVRIAREMVHRGK